MCLKANKAIFKRSQNYVYVYLFKYGPAGPCQVRRVQTVENCPNPGAVTCVAQPKMKGGG